MLFRMIVSEGLSHYSYFIGSGTTAAVIDPRRDCRVYADLAAENGMQIRYIFETHRNEDFCSGSVALAAQTGADILHGSALPFRFGRPVHGGDRFRIGNLVAMVRETPGHTRESISIAVWEPSVSPQVLMIFTGDALLAGDTGRVDFFGPEKTPEMAGLLFDSLKNEILADGEGVIVCPAHGAGSICGGSIQDRPVTTSGYEIRSNPALSLSRDAFVAGKSAEQHYTPPYFRKMEEYNLNGPPSPDENLVFRALGHREFQDLRTAGGVVVDIRSPGAFGGGHIPGSLSIWRNGISAFAGWFLDYDHPVLIIDDFPRFPEDVSTALYRLGYDNLAGFYSGGFPAWTRLSGHEVSFLPVWGVNDLAMAIGDGEDMCILDVRDIVNRRKAGHISGSFHAYAGEIPATAQDLPKDRHIVVICDAGFKGSLVASYLVRNGFSHVTNVLGGMTAWSGAGFPVVKE